MIYYLHIFKKTPEWAENISGVPAKTINKFADILSKKTKLF